MLPLALVLAVATPFFGWGQGSAPIDPEGPALVLDVSSYQGSINWEKAADFGVRAVYQKLSEGEDYRDPSFSEERRQALQEAGVLYGFYHFVRPRKRPAFREARWFARQAQEAGGWGQLVPALDIESTELGPADTGRYLAELVRSLRQQGVRQMLLYASPDWWRSNVALVPELRSVLRWLRPWIAHWGVSRPQNLQGFSGYVLHQYTSSGKIPGISGNVDLNRASDLSRLLRKKR